MLASLTILGKTNKTKSQAHCVNQLHSGEQAKLSRHLTYLPSRYSEAHSSWDMAFQKLAWW
jgi:hypothetical protein